MIRKRWLQVDRRGARWLVWGVFALLLFGVSGPALGQSGASVSFSEVGYAPLAWLPAGDGLIAGRAGEVVRLSDTQALQLNELWLLPLDGSPRRLTANGVLPAVSPDGKRLAFLAYAGESLWATTVLDLRSGAETRLLAAPWDIRRAPRWDDAGEVSLASAADVADQRSVAPDGRWVAGIDTGFGPSATLWIEDTQTGTRRVIMDGERWFLSRLSWSPDGRQAAFSRTAPGTAMQGQLCRLDVASGAITVIGAGDGPLWSPDGRWIAYSSDGRVRLAPADAPPYRHELVPAVPETDGGAAPAAAADEQLTPPAIIRVVHWSQNTCRPDVPVGRIDTIGFENYVKRVTPHEVYTTWESEALKAQAVAARSFAWWYTLRPAGEGYDLSDTTYHQYMCDTTAPTTDAAVDATRGQYIAYQGDIIFAQFSAENGSPTRDGGRPYLRSVDDPVGFGQELYGHGWGMSQWGAQRWALRYKWNYEQILTHYYTGVTVERPANSGPTPAEPAGSVVRPWLGWYVNSNRIWLRANASDGDGDLAGVSYAARWLDAGGQARQQTLGAAIRGDDGWYLLWDVTALPDQGMLSDTLIITATAQDASERSGALSMSRIGLDRGAPAGCASAPAVVATSTISLTISGATDAVSGVEGVLVSNNWVWEGESGALGHEAGTGVVVSDTAALNGAAWFGRAGIDRAGAWFGPYTYALPSGRPYRALFRLKTDAITQTAEIATLDVVDSGGTRLLGLRRLRGVDFREANVYQEIAVDFYLWDVGTSGLEFRIAYKGIANLYYDRVLVAGYPIEVAPAISWEVPNVAGSQTVQVKLADRAGNVSADQTLAIQVITPTPSPSPTASATLTPSATPAATSSPTPSPSATRTPTRTPTATPFGDAQIHLILGSIFADLNANGVRDAGEPYLNDVRLQFLDAERRPVVAGVTAGSWTFLVRVPVGQFYYFVAARPGFQARVERIVAPSVPSQLDLHWVTLGLRPWDTGAMLPLIPR
jgi:hypothetical protein